MKKLDRDNLVHVQRAAEKRFLRSIRNRRPNKRRSTKRRSGLTAPIEAPAKLDIYLSHNHKAFIEFISRLREKCKHNKNIFISFKNTHRISAAAALLLYAETDRLISAFPDLKIRCSFPPALSEGKYKNNNYLVESSLKQVGFFKLIGQSSTKTTNQVSVRRWQQLSGNTADGSLANKLLDTLGASISKRAKQRLYRGAIEAISNCVEHAYPEIRKDGLNIDDKRWWMLVGMDDHIISVIVCDLGVGIPETLPRKNPESIINRIYKKLNIQDQSDGEMIRASTYIRRTRTGLSNRGKGGQDFRSVVEVFPSAMLSIRSNRGCYVLAGPNSKKIRKDRNRRFIDELKRAEAVSNHSSSIRGTLIEWVVSKQDLIT
jgi:hypothetical protein